nr:uncharacterized protein LOC108179992 [Danio rerio]|eukprot:XP_021323635.1 uncharacterized protein LOC108179992 [Danio rerio]
MTAAEIRRLSKLSKERLLEDFLKMPRGKGYRRSQAAKRRNAERITLTSPLDLAEVKPPLKKKAEFIESSSNNPEIYQTADTSLNCCMDPNTSPNCRKAPNTSPNCRKALNTSPNCRKAPNTSPNCRKAPNTSPICRKAPNTSPICRKAPNVSNDVNQCFNVNNSDYFPQKFIQGSFHQCDERFGFNRNRQCAVNSITAVMMSVLKHVQTWTTDDLNAVLLHGDKLYTSMCQQGKINDHLQRGYVSVAELPTVHTLYDTNLSIKYSESLSGVVGVDVYDDSLRDVCMSIEEALQRALVQSDACLLNIRDNICAVIKVESEFAVVDSHSRNGKGNTF